MDEQQTSQYLANVLSVARANGTLTPEEESAVEEMRLALKAKKKQLSDARKLAASEDFELKPVGRYSEQIRNIEDMVYLALIDQELASEEKQAIVDFAKRVGITQEQINRVLSETKARVRKATQELACPSCRSQIPAASKFCPECGTSFTQMIKPGGTKVKFDYPLEGISIEFPESSSASFHAALGAAKEAPEFQECKRDKKTWYLATWPRERIADAVELADNLKRLRNRTVYVDGQTMGWDEVFGFVSCYRQRQEAYRPVEYCFGIDDKRLNIWGCKQAGMDWTSWAHWFSYGQFRKKDVFLFDKRRIRHELETNLVHPTEGYLGLKKGGHAGLL